MRQYTIAKTLALFLGVLSVVARSLPKRKSEINVRSPGDVSDPKQHLEELGLARVSEGVIDGEIHTATYSMSNNTTFTKRVTSTDSSLGCDIICVPTDPVVHTSEVPPDLNDCHNLHRYFASPQGFTVGPESSTVPFTLNTCVVQLINPSPDTPWNSRFDTLFDTMEGIVNECYIQRTSRFASCMYMRDMENPSHNPSISVSRLVP